MVECVKIPPHPPGGLSSQDLGDNHQKKGHIPRYQVWKFGITEFGAGKHPRKNVRCLPLWTWLSHWKYPKRNIYKFPVLKYLPTKIPGDVLMPTSELEKNEFSVNFWEAKSLAMKSWLVYGGIPISWLIITLT